MPMPLPKKFLKVGAVALVMSSVGTASLFVNADAAYAERGGAKSGGGQSHNNGNGSVSRELRGMNSAHANQNARDRANPNSMVGRTATYQAAAQQRATELNTLRTEQQIAIDELNRLTGLSDDDIADEFPNGGYDAAVNAANEEYLRTQNAIIAIGENDANDLSILSGGRDLSENAISEFKRLLGL